MPDAPKGGIPAFMAKKAAAGKPDPRMEARKGVAAKRLAAMKAKKGK